MDIVTAYVSDDMLRQALANARSIAVVGAKDKPDQPVDRVGRYLIAAGYRVIPVHPVRRDVWGLPTYTSLVEIPEHVDIVCLFRASAYCEAHAHEVLRMASRPSVFWMQQGITSAAAYRLLHESEQAKGADVPMLVVQNMCIKIEHQRLNNGQLR